MRLSPLITKQTCHSIAYWFSRVLDHNVIAVQIDIDPLVSSFVLPAFNFNPVRVDIIK
jgi:hypothetical protein